MTTADLRGAQAAAEQRIRLLAANDLPGMAALLDADLVYVHSTGQVHGKAQLLDFLEQELLVLAMERQPVMAVGQGDLALLAFTQLMHARPVCAPDVSIQTKTHFTETWRQRGGAWQLLHAQSTALGHSPTNHCTG